MDKFYSDNQPFVYLSIYLPTFRHTTANQNPAKDVPKKE